MERPPFACCHIHRLKHRKQNMEIVINIEIKKYRSSLSEQMQYDSHPSLRGGKNLFRSQTRSSQPLHQHQRRRQLRWPQQLVECNISRNFLHGPSGQTRWDGVCEHASCSCHPESLPSLSGILVWSLHYQPCLHRKQPCTWYSHGKHHMYNNSYNKEGSMQKSKHGKDASSAHSRMASGA